MIYIVEDNGLERKIIVPDNAHLITADDEKYFQEKADKETERRSIDILINDKYDKITQMQYEIGKLKRNLDNTDYQAIKFFDGEMSAEDYAPVKEQRKGWRKDINNLEKEIETEKNNIHELVELKK